MEERRGKAWKRARTSVENVEETTWDASNVGVTSTMGDAIGQAMLALLFSD